MFAVVAHGAFDFRCQQVPMPVMGPGEVLLKVEAAGICASERALYKGGDPWGTGGIPPSYIPGHEFSGTVVELGEGASEATGLRAGDLAVAEIIVPCRRCFYCLRGLYHLCADPAGWLAGGWAEYVGIPAGAILWKVPSGIPAREAALIEPLACAAHGVQRARIEPGDTVVVGGLGSIGMGMLQMARLRSPHRLIGLDLDENLCRLALELGADSAFNPARDDVEAEIAALTAGLGCEVYLEASGSVASLQTAFRVLRKRGRLLVYALYGKDAALDFNQVSQFKELEILGGHLSPWTYPQVMEYLERRLVDAGSMITDVYPLSEVQQALRCKDQPAHTSIKTLLIP